MSRQSHAEQVLRDFRADMRAMKKEVDDLVAKLGKKDEAQGALEALAAMAKDKGAAAEPFLVGAVDKILEAAADKQKPVAAAAVETAKAIAESMSPYAIDAVMPQLLAGLAVKAKPPTKEATLNVIAKIAETSPKAIGYALVTLCAPVAELTALRDELASVQKELDTTEKEKQQHEEEEQQHGEQDPEKKKKASRMCGLWLDCNLEPLHSGWLWFDASRDVQRPKTSRRHLPTSPSCSKSP